MSLEIIFINYKRVQNSSNLQFTTYSTSKYLQLYAKINLKLLLFNNRIDAILQNKKTGYDFKTVNIFNEFDGVN